MTEKFRRAAMLLANSIIDNLLEKYEIPREVIKRYYEPHRVYHNIDHISSMMEIAWTKYKETDYYENLFRG